MTAILHQRHDHDPVKQRPVCESGTFIRLLKFGPSHLHTAKISTEQQLTSAAGISMLASVAMWSSL